MKDFDRELTIGLLESLGAPCRQMLEKSYNFEGIHRWMHEPHKELGGHTPAQCIIYPDDSKRRQLRDLILKGAIGMAT